MYKICTMEFKEKTAIWETYNLLNNRDKKLLLNQLKESGISHPILKNYMYGITEPTISKAKVFKDTINKLLPRKYKIKTIENLI